MKCIKTKYRTIILSSLLLSLNISVSQAFEAKHILVFGDSLSAAYGMKLEQGWVHLLAKNLGDEYKVSNASISGEATSGGLARLPLTLEELKPDLVLIELGANDGLRGYPISTINNNLISMIDLVEQAGAKAAIASVSLPPSYGPRYIAQFRSVFTDVAAEKNVPMIDLYNDDFFKNPEYIQDDGLHPTAITQPLIRDSMIDFLKQQKLLD